MRKAGRRRRAEASGRGTTRRSRCAFAIVAAMVVLLQAVAVSAAPVVDTSTTGVRILTIPTPDRLFDVGPGEPPVAFHPPLQPVAMADNVVVLNDPVSGEVLVWDGNGYPTSIVDDFPADALTFADDVNSSGTVAGTVFTGGQSRGFVWSDDGGYVDVGDPPGSVPDVASDPEGFGPQVRVTGIAETGWIVGTFRADAGVCSAAVTSCGFRGVPNGSGYDLIPFGGLFSPQDIELVTLGGGATEHVAVGVPSGVWTETAGIAALDDGGLGGAVEGVDLNQSGEIVGSMFDPTGPTVVAAYWPGPTGSPTVINTDGFASAIGDDGTVVGNAAFPFSWTPGSGSVADLGRLPGAQTSEAHAINGSGQIAGTSNGLAVIFDLTGAYEIDYPPHVDLDNLYAAAEAGQNLVYTPVVTELEDDPWIVEWENLPTGAVWSDGSLSWQTTATDVGVATPTMTVSVPGEPNTASSATVTLEVLEPSVADLAVEVIEPGPTVESAVGTPVSFVFDVTNAGPATATSVSATVDLPSGAVVEDLDPTCEHVEPSSAVECDVGTLDESQRLAFTVRFPASGDVNVEIVVGGEQADPNAADNSTVVLVQVAGIVADLSIGLVAPTSTRFLAGESIPFVFQVDNAGPDEAGGVTAMVDLPPGATIADLDGGCIDPAGTVDVMCDLGTVIGAAQFGFSASFTDAGNFLVDATVTGQASDPDLTNNAVFPDVEILARADLLDPIGDRTISPLAALAIAVTSVADDPIYRVRWMNPPDGHPTLSLPAGMSTDVSAALGELIVSWTPTISQVGFYQFEFAVIDESDPDNPEADSETVGILVRGLPLRGTTWYDLDEDGTRLGPNGDLEPLIGGVTVYIDQDDDGSRDDGEPNTTSSNGYFYFSGHAPVNSEIVVRQELPADFLQTTPSFGDGIRLTLTGGAPALSLDFGSRPVDPTAVPQIFGTVWNDVDCAGASGGGEAGVAGVEIRVERLGLDGVFFPYATASTGPGGTYAFSGLPDDTYRIHMDVPDGFEHTAPGSTSRVANHQVVVDGTLLHGGKDFGVAAAGSCPGAIYGTVWHDVDRDGSFDAAEEPLDLLFASAWLDEDDDGLRDRSEPLGYLVGPGRYRIHPVGPGNHIVRSAIPSTFPIRTAPGGDNSYLVSLGAGETVSSIDFGFATDDDPDDRPPVVRSISDQLVIAGDKVEVEIVASDPENDPFTLSLGTNPGGAIVDGTYAWETADQAPGTYRVTVYATQDDDPTKVGLSIFDIEILSRHGDEDGDGIANAIDGYVNAGFPFVSRATVASFDFTDQHRAGSSPDGVGTSFGTVFSGPELIVADSAFPAVGVLATNGDDTAAVRFCGSRASTILGPNSSTEHTCGSHTMTVLAGSGSLATSDGAVIDITAGSTVRLEDGGGPVAVTVVAGSATVTVDGSSLVLDETDPVLIDPSDVLGDDDGDGLTNAEELLTGTDPTDPDTDGDGVVDSIDTSWLISYLDEVPNGHFKRRLHRTLMKVTIKIAATAVRLGRPDLAVGIVDALDRRVDGCGDTPDSSDWITHCESQVELRDLLALYRRGISMLLLPEQ